MFVLCFNLLKTSVQSGSQLPEDQSLDVQREGRQMVLPVLLVP